MLHNREGRRPETRKVALADDGDARVARIHVLREGERIVLVQLEHGVAEGDGQLRPDLLTGVRLILHGGDADAAVRDAARLDGQRAGFRRDRVVRVFAQLHDVGVDVRILARLAGQAVVELIARQHAVCGDLRGRVCVAVDLLAVLHGQGRLGRVHLDANRHQQLFFAVFIVCRVVGRIGDSIEQRLRIRPVVRNRPLEAAVVVRGMAQLRVTQGLPVGDFACGRPADGRSLRLCDGHGARVHLADGVVRSARTRERHAREGDGLVRARARVADGGGRVRHVQAHLVAGQHAVKRPAHSG